MEKEENTSKIFNELSGIQVKTEQKPDGYNRTITYASWPWVFGELFKRFPDFKYRIIEFDENGKELEPGTHGYPYQVVKSEVPFTKDDIANAVAAYQAEYKSWAVITKALSNAGVSSDLLGSDRPVAPDPVKLAQATKPVIAGYNVWTEMTINGITRKQWLPIRSKNNNVVKAAPYEKTSKSGYPILVEGFDSVLLNNAIMRCFVKNAAMFGLGLYIYGGEESPEQLQPVYGAPQQMRPQPQYQQPPVQPEYGNYGPDYSQMPPQQYPQNNQLRPVAQPQQAPVQSQPQAQPQQSVQSGQTTSSGMDSMLETAMNHVIEGSVGGLDNLIGHKMRELVEKATNITAANGVLMEYSKGQNKDSVAARVILNALSKGELHYPDQI